MFSRFKREDSAESTLRKASRQLKINAQVHQRDASQVIETVPFYTVEDMDDTSRKAKDLMGRLLHTGTANIALGDLEEVMENLKTCRKEHDKIADQLIGREANLDDQLSLKRSKKTFRNWVDSNLQDLDAARKELGAEDSFEIYSSVSATPSEGQSSELSGLEMELIEAKTKAHVSEAKLLIEKEEMELEMKKRLLDMQRRQIEDQEKIMLLEAKVNAERASLEGSRQASRRASPVLDSKADTILSSILKPTRSSVLGMEKKENVNLVSPPSTTMRVSPPTSSSLTMAPRLKLLSSQPTMDPATRHLLKDGLIKNPIFVFHGDSGKYVSWSNYINNRVHELNLSASDILDVLRAHSSGEPRDLIDLYTSSNMDDQDERETLKIVWEKLKQRYGSAARVAKSLRKEIEAFPAVSGQNIGLKMTKLSDLCMKLQLAIAKSDNLVDFQTSTGLECLRAKLPVAYQKRWAREGKLYERRNGQRPPFQYFCQWLETEAEIAFDPSYEILETKKPEKDKKDKNQGKSNSDKEKNKHTSMKTDSAEVKDGKPEQKKDEKNKKNGKKDAEDKAKGSFSKDQPICHLHKNANHSLDKCFIYKELPEECKAVVLQQGWNKMAEADQKEAKPAQTSD